MKIWWTNKFVSNTTFIYYRKSPFRTRYFNIFFIKIFPIFRTFIQKTTSLLKLTVNYNILHIKYCITTSMNFELPQHNFDNNNDNSNYLQ